MGLLGVNREELLSLVQSKLIDVSSKYAPICLSMVASMELETGIYVRSDVVFPTTALLSFMTYSDTRILNDKVDLQLGHLAVPYYVKLHR